MLVPLHAFVRGDTIGLLVLVHDRDTIASLAEQAATAASVRVAVRGRLVVCHGDRVLDPELTVAEAGLTALERVDLLPEGEP